MQSCSGVTAQKLRKSQGGRPGLPVPNGLCGLCGHEATPNWPEPRSCVKVRVAVLGSPSPVVLVVSVDVKQHWTWTPAVGCCRPENGHPGCRDPRTIQDGFCRARSVRSAVAVAGDSISLIHSLLTSALAYIPPPRPPPPHPSPMKIKRLPLVSQDCVVNFGCCWGFHLIHSLLPSAVSFLPPPHPHPSTPTPPCPHPPILCEHSKWYDNVKMNSDGLPTLSQNMLVEVKNRSQCNAVKVP